MDCNNQLIIIYISGKKVKSVKTNKKGVAKLNHKDSRHIQDHRQIPRGKCDQEIDSKAGIDIEDRQGQKVRQKAGFKSNFKEGQEGLEKQEGNLQVQRQNLQGKGQQEGNRQGYS